MAVFDAFLGGTFQQRSVNVAAQRTMNLYPEGQEVPGGKTQTALYSRLGIKSGWSLGGAACRGLFAQNGRCFAVVDNQLWELFSNYTASALGAVVNDDLPALLCSNGQAGNQLMIQSGGAGYIYNLSTGVFVKITDPSFLPTTRIGFVDGYFLSQITATAKFQTCKLEDGTVWTANVGGAGTGERSEGSDNISAMVVDHRYIWLLGSRTAEIWYDAGGTFPYLPIPSLFIEMGCAATYSPAQLANGLAWIAQSFRGDAYAVMANGPTAAPTRISTMGVEWLWSQYPTVSDAVGFSVEWQGHSFWYLYFPTAGTTWVYDASQPPPLAWHEEGYWNAETALYEAALPRCHAYAFGQHLVGLRNSGRVGVLDANTFTDLDNPIRWYRQAAHLCTEQVRQIHDRLQVDLETGVGLSTGQGSHPLIWATWSDDGGHTWSAEHQMSIGKEGQYAFRAYLTRLGQTRDRIYQVAGSDPCKTALVAAYLNTRQGSS